MAVTRAPELADWLLARGRGAVSTAEAAELLGVPDDQVRVRLAPALRTHRMVSPSRGLWVVVPAEYRTWGAPPVLDFLDPLMTHLHRDYYVGWLSAAELHGAAHQRPQVTQIAVDRQLADRDLGRSRLRFHLRAEAATLPRVRHTVPTGQVWASTPELTALDLVDRPDLGAGLSNVATVLAELAEGSTLDPARILEAATRFPAAALRRLGYLLELVEAPLDSASLAAQAAGTPLARPAMLDPASPRRGEVDARWGLLLNTDVEPDL